MLSDLPGSVHDASLQLLYFCLESAVFFKLFRDFVDSVHDSCMVPVAELLSDLWKGDPGQFPAEIHGDLSRMSNIFLSF